MLKDKISIRNLQSFCRIGVYDHERVLGQSLDMNIDLFFDLAKAGKSNKIEDSVDYVDVSLTIRTLSQSKDFLLLENLAEEICETLFNKFKIVEGIQVEIAKPIVNAEQFTGLPVVTIYRERA